MDWEKLLYVVGAVVGIVGGFAGTIIALYGRFNKTRLDNRTAEVKLTQEEQAAALAMRAQSQQLQQAAEKINRDEIIQHFHGLYEERKKRHKEDVDRLEKEIGSLRSDNIGLREEMSVAINHLREEKDEEIRDLRDREYKCREEMAEVKQVLRNHGIRFKRDGDQDTPVPRVPPTQPGA